MHTNAVLQLRQQELAQSTREFRARGSKVVRCEGCLLPVPDCICAVRPLVASRSAFCFIMYPGESYKPSNTGRLIADVVTDSHAFRWQRLEAQPGLQALLADGRYAPMLVFPHEYAAPQRCISSPADLPAVQAGKIPLFVMLDGTWREARKMFNSTYLDVLPVLGIQPEKVSSYLMRDAAHLHQLCTAEVGIEILKLAGDHEAASALQDYFTVFCLKYAAIRPHLLEKQR